MGTIYYTGVKPLLLSVLLLALLFSACNRGSQPRMLGSDAPDFTLTDSDRTVSLHDLKGKTIVLNFWTSWCGPCIDEMPSLIKLQKIMGQQVAVLAVSWDVDDGAYHRFLRDYNVDLLTVRDGRSESKYLYGCTSQPETFIIDASGKIRRKYIGPRNWVDPEMIQYLKTL